MITPKKIMIYIPGWGHEKQAINSRSFMNLNDAFCEEWDMYYFDYDHTTSPKQIKSLLKEKFQPFNNPNNNVLIVGQSYGGYWANQMASEFGLKTVLINPAIQPDQTLRKYEILTQDQLSQFTPFSIKMDTPRMVLLSEGDEIVPPEKTLEKLGSDLELYLLPDATHQLRNTDWTLIIQFVHKFIKASK